MHNTNQLHLLAEGDMAPTIIGLAIIVFVIAGVWKMFEKAGQPGWAAIIPIYNIIVMLQVAKKPVWWVLLYFIPIANIIVAVLVALSLAENFGKSAGFGIGILFLSFIFLPILGFGSAQYQPAADIRV